MSREDEPKPGVPAETLDAYIRGYLERILAPDEIASLTAPGEHARRPDELDRAQRTALASLRGLLENDVHVAVPFDEALGINEAEREREIAKAALARLKVKQLVEIADRYGLRKTGTRDDLVERLVLHIGPDEQQIAELVLKYGDESSGRRRHVTRLVPITGLSSLKDAALRLAEFEGRYLRTGVAEWFVFSDAALGRDELLVEGVLRSYEVEAAGLVVGARGKYGLRTDQRDDDAVVKLRAGQHVLRVQAHGYRESRAAARAFRFAAGLTIGEQLFPTAPYSFAEVPTVAPQSAWLLALTWQLVHRAPIQVDAVTSVTFARGRNSGPSSGDRPRIESSRFNGHHVLDTPQIARYIAEGQVLAAISFAASIAAPDGVQSSLPCRLAVEDGVLAISTGFGRLGPDSAGGLHQRLEEIVAIATTTWPLGSQSTIDVLDEVKRRASDTASPRRASLFATASSTGRVEAHPA